MTTSSSAGTFYRILRSEQAQEVDFECDALRVFRATQAGMPARYTPRNGLELRQWSGISMYDSLQAATDRAQKHTTLGQFIAEVVLPPSNGKNVLLEPFGGPNHYIIWARPDLLLNCVRRVQRVI